MNNLKTIISITLLISNLTFVGYISNSAIAIPSDLLVHKYVFGPLVGVTSNDTGNVDWVLSGTWRSMLSNDTVSNTNENVSLGNLSSGVFKAAIEMIKPDGTARHTHTLTDFVVMNVTQNANSNSTTFNGTSTIIQRSANGNVFIITIDPESVDYHFGKSPLIYGISANPAFMKMPHIAR